MTGAEARMRAAPRMTTAATVVEALVAHGLTTLYALPGVHNDPLFDALHAAADRIRVIHPRHEQAAGYMALGAALASGQPQAFSVVPGPGLLNAGAALLNAYGLGAPVLALAGQIPHNAIDRGYGHLHELPDQLGLLRHLTKFAARITHPGEAPGLIAEALAKAQAGRARPVALECAIDVWGREAPVAPVAPLARVALAPDPEGVAKAAALLDRAERPLIVVGGGALDAAPALRALAEALAAPVMSFRRGRGILPSDHPLAVSWPVGHRLWAEADAVLAVGTRLHVPLSVWGSDPALKLIRLDVDAEEIERQRRPDAAILADAALGLAALCEALPRRARPARADVAAAQAWFGGELARLAPQLEFLGAIRAALPEDGIVVEDVTQMGFVGRLAFPVTAPRRYLSPGYQDNLGWGYGAALGAKAALPDRPVVLLSGDGGFLYQAGEMATAMRHGIAVVAVVFDDGAFGNVRRIQAEQYGNRLIACDLHNPDFVRMAESFGLAAWRADTPAALRAALDAALARQAPALIHVRLGELPSPWPLILLPRVRGFEESWRRAWP